MSKLLIALLAALAFPIGTVSSHGYDENCSEECNDYYCPPEHGKNREKTSNFR